MVVSGDEGIGNHRHIRAFSAVTPPDGALVTRVENEAFVGVVELFQDFAIAVNDDGSKVRAAEDGMNIGKDGLAFAASRGTHIKETIVFQIGGDGEIADFQQLSVFGDSSGG
jgi:hypothetical protein